MCLGLCIVVAFSPACKRHSPVPAISLRLASFVKTGTDLWRPSDPVSSWIDPVWRIWTRSLSVGRRCLRLRDDKHEKYWHKTRSQTRDASSKVIVSSRKKDNMLSTTPRG